MVSMPNLQDIAIPELPARNSSLRKVDTADYGSGSIGNKPAPVLALFPPLGSDVASRWTQPGSVSGQGKGFLFFVF